MKFKVGDRVVVARKCRQQGCPICPEMIGKEYTIRNIRIVEAFGIVAGFESSSPYDEALIEQLEFVHDNTPLPLPG